MTSTEAGPSTGHGVPSPPESGEELGVADGAQPRGAWGTTVPPIADPQPDRPVEAVVRRRRVEGRQRRLTVWQLAFSALFAVALLALAFLGYKASLRIGGGSSERITDPDAPGYVAEPRPSTVELYVATTPEGALASALVMVPDSSGQGGSVVPLPPSLVLPELEGSPPVFLGELFATGGIEAVRERLGVALGFRIGSAATVPPDAVAEMAGGSPVVIDNVDNLIERTPDGVETLRYPAGDLSIAPEEVAGFLAFQGADDPAPNQALRAQLVWEQLFAAATGRDLAALPEGEQSEGSQSPGFGEAVTALLAGEPRFELLPMADVPVPNSYFVAWMPDSAALGRFVSRVVPLPESPVPGARVPVAVLDGTGDDSSISAVVPAVVAAGGEIALVGNAESRSVPTTRVEYTSPNVQPVADAIAAELGVTATAGVTPVEGVSVNVVIGADRAG